MNTQTEATTSVVDIVKQVFCVAFVIAGVSAFYYFSEMQLLYRVVSLLVVLLTVIGLMSTTAIGKKVLGFIMDAKQEVRKVVWPTRDETMRTTLLVFAMVFIVGLLLGILDKVLFEGVRLLTGQGS
jgi:preprotein translocase subunit SecE